MTILDYEGNGRVELDGRTFVLCSCAGGETGKLAPPDACMDGEEWCQLPAIDLSEPEVKTGCYRFGMLAFGREDGRIVAQSFSRGNAHALYDIYEDDFVQDGAWCSKR